MIFMLLILGVVVATVVIVVGLFIANRARGSTRAPGGSVPTYSAPDPLLHLPLTVRHEVQELAQQGNKIAAIKLLRDHARVGLKEAKDYVEQLERAPVGAAPAPSSRMPSAEEIEELRRLAAQGRKIEAIKQYREITGAGLKEAKDAVEAL